jgi:AcrR family transcriptional regulator
MPVSTSTGARTPGRRERADARTVRVRPGSGRHPGGAEREQRRPGRPRSEQADQAIMTAALELFAESGPAGLCIEQVAARAGVGKATIYRRWPGKEDMLLDALPLLASALPVPQGRSVRADLVALLDASGKEATDPRRRRLIALLQGEGVQYPRLKASYLATVVHPRREAFRKVLRRGVATGELREDTDIEAAMYLLNGAVVASMSGMHSDLVDSRYARRVVAELLRGLGAR